MDDLEAYSRGDPQLPYVEGCSRGELVFARCRSCGGAQLPAHRTCQHCGSRDLSSEVSGGRGTIASFSIVHRAASPHFQTRVPFVLVLVDLEEGFRAMMRFDGDSEPAIGIRVRIRFADDGPEGESLPHAVPMEPHNDL